MVVDILRMDPGITLIEAVNGNDALDLAGRVPADVIIAESNLAVAAAMQATRTIAIVMAAATGAVHAGFVSEPCSSGGQRHQAYR